VLVLALPADSRFGKTVRQRRAAAGIVDTPSPIEEAPADTLSQVEWLMLALHDQLQLLNFAYLQAHTQRRLPPPALLPRPGAVTKRRQTLNAWFGAVGLRPLDKPLAPTT
jgi:hypothetical protein